MTRTTIANVTHVFYHAGCADGLFSAYAVYAARPDVEFIAVNYGTPAFDMTGRNVLILDFAWSRTEMLEIERVADSLLVIDHHETHAEALAPLRDEHKMFNLNRAAASEVRKWVLDQSPDTDLGDEYVWELVHQYDTRTAPAGSTDWIYFNLAFENGRSRYALTFADVKNALDAWRHEESRRAFLAVGRNLFVQMQEIVDFNIANSIVYTVNMDGQEITIFERNAYLHVNETADRLRELNASGEVVCDVFISFYIDVAESKTQFSLRTTSPRCPHLGQLCAGVRERYGEKSGGGHPGAAAMRSNTIRTTFPFDERTIIENPRRVDDYPEVKLAALAARLDSATRLGLARQLRRKLLTRNCLPIAGVNERLGLLPVNRPLVVAYVNSEIVGDEIYGLLLDNMEVDLLITFTVIGDEHAFGCHIDVINDAILINPSSETDESGLARDEVVGTRFMYMTSDFAMTFPFEVQNTEPGQ
jgi:hypothetical protein